MLFLLLTCSYFSCETDHGTTHALPVLLMPCLIDDTRGQVATQEERDAVMDLVYQLEARNPMPDATNVNSVGKSERRRHSERVRGAGYQLVSVNANGPA